MKIFFTFLTLLASSAFAQESVSGSVTYGKYNVYDYPRPAGKSCLDIATGVGNRLVSIAQKQGYPDAKLWNVSCLFEDYNYVSFRVNYRAAVIIPKVTTNESYGYEAESTGTFPTREACEHDLYYGSGTGSQIDYFRKATGMEPVVAYCVNTGGSFWTAPYALRIESFGNSKAKSFIFGSFVGQPVTNANLVMQEVLDNAAKQHIAMNSVVIAHDPHTEAHQIMLTYYSPNILPLSLLRPFVYSSVEWCTQQTEEVRKAYQSVAASMPLTLFCSTDAYLNVLSLVDSGFTIFAAPQPYQSMTDCLADRTRVLKYYQDVEKWDARYAVCNGYREIRMKIFTKIVPTP